MKFTAIILLSACLAASAKGYSQKITLSEKNAPLEKIFSEIKKQSGFTFAYTESILSNAKKVTVEVNNVSLEQVLNICFSEQPFTYTIIEKTIVVKPKSPNEVITTEPASIDVKGRVVNENGDPVEGVSVKVKGTTNGTATNANGEFTLTGVDENATLVFTSTNVETYEVKLNGRTELALSLKTKISSLLEVIVNKGYYNEKRAITTGNVYTVTTTDIAKQPVNNPLLALYNVPGMFITQASGFSGSGVTVHIQGINSIGKGNDPFYVIDGVPFASQLSPSIGGILGTSGNGFGVQQGNPLSYINPGDIESIDVLKDADATAIYGSRAANGAILITTKKGRVGKTKVDINMQAGWGQVSRKLDMLNTQQYLQMRHEAKQNDGLTTGATDYDINGFWDSTRHTDWQKELIGSTARYTDVQASVSGGTANTNFLVGAGYHRETTVFPGEFADIKGSVHFNLNNVSTNQKFRLQLSGSYLVDDNQLPQSDLTNTAITFAPNAPALYNVDGSLNWAPLTPGNLGTWNNPLAALNIRYKNKTNNLVSNAIASYQILPGLEIMSRFGYANMQTNESIITPALFEDPYWWPIDGIYARSAIYGNDNINSWIIEPQLNYKWAIGKGKIEALFGTTIQQNNTNGQQLSGKGYNSDRVLEDIKSAATVTIGSTTVSNYKYNAAFGRLNYNWKDKYIINVTARRDGSSRFGSQSQFHNFGAAGIVWIFSKENFIQKSLPFISFGKIRGSYGTTGNDQIGDYQFLNLYSPISNVGVPYQGAPGLEINGLPNPHLEWEETKKLQFGLDLGLFNDRIMISTDYFHNRSSNQLLAFPLPILTGFTNISGNLPATVQNTGWEFSLITANLKTTNFNWTSSFNITIPKNKLVAFPNLANSFFASVLVMGQPILITKAYHLIDVNPTTGIYEFADKNGNVTSSPNYSADRTVLIKNSFPTYYGGFQNSFRYKGIELDVLFQFVKQIGPNYLFGNGFGGFFPNINQPVYVLDRWQKPGDIATHQRYNSNFSLYNQISAALSSDAAYSDASYMRLKNLSVSWQLPERWRQKARLQNCRLYMQGQNLLTITKYKGLDPETKSSTTLPPLRVLTMGIQVTL